MHFQTANASLSPSKLSTSTLNENSDNPLVSRTKEVFERLFPAVASNVDYDTWLQNLTSQIEQLQQQSQQNCLKQTKSNHQQNGDDDSDPDENGTGNGTTHHHSQDNGVKVSPSTEDLLLQNAQLKTTVDEYKTIVADTVS